jgi:hypothetical protein
MYAFDGLSFKIIHEILKYFSDALPGRHRKDLDRIQAINSIFQKRKRSFWATSRKMDARIVDFNVDRRYDSKGAKPGRVAPSLSLRIAVPAHAFASTSKMKPFTIAARFQRLPSFLYILWGDCWIIQQDACQNF